MLRALSSAVVLALVPVAGCLLEPPGVGTERESEEQHPGKNKTAHGGKQ